MFNFFKPSVPQVSVEVVKQSMDHKEQFILVDVRTPGEYERAKLQGSINIPVEEIAHSIETTIPDKSKKIYVYCMSGSRSVHAVSEMIALGYSDVYDVQNGLLAWRVKRFPVVSATGY